MAALSFSFPMLSLLTVVFGGLIVLIWNPISRQWDTDRSAFHRNDAMAIAIGLVCGGLVYWQLQVSSQAPWLDRTTRYAMVSLLLSISLGGIAAALFGRGRRFLVPTMLTLQGVIVLCLVVPDYGFDHASSWGLDFGDLVMLGLCYVLAAVVGFAAAILSRWRNAVLLQAAWVAISVPFTLLIMFAKDG